MPKQKLKWSKRMKTDFKQQDDLFNAALGKALKEATQPEKQGDPSKKIQAEVKAKLEKRAWSRAREQPVVPNQTTGRRRNP